MNSNLSTHLTTLIQQARSGDGEALGKVLNQYRSYLRVLASNQLHHRLREKADPSDIVQETCLEAHQHIGSFRGATSSEFAAWLRAILAHRLARHTRSFLGTQARDIRLEEILTHELEQASGFFAAALGNRQPSPSEAMMATETVLELADAIEKLPEDYRTVILLRNMQGMAFGEVAQSMNRTVDSVEKLWVRALAKLREAMPDPH
jgi:RNA polymerase sigma-70 factor, ECF subfamily